MADVIDEKKAIRHDGDSTSGDQQAAVPIEKGELVNASGHIQELDRNFNLLSLAGVGLVVGNVWPAVGGSILVAIFNGGPPVFYWIVAASIAELASAITSSGGVYHWASVTPRRRWGRVVGFFAGYWNWLAWVFGAASMSFVFPNTIVQMYGVTHHGFEAKPWHVFVMYLISTWLACFCVCFFNKAMPHLNAVGIFLVLAGSFVTVIVVAAMPGHDGRPPHASSSFVWSQWTADIGYTNGFIAGMLNGARCHLAEEIPNPQRNVPIAIGLQMSIRFLTGLCYIIAIMYAINDFNALIDSPFPIAEIYLQATGSSSGAIGLLCLILFCVTVCMIGVYITAGRTLWTLGRDRATLFPNS